MIGTFGVATLLYLAWIYCLERPTAIDSRAQDHHMVLTIKWETIIWDHKTIIWEKQNVTRHHPTLLGYCFITEHNSLVNAATY